MRFGYDIKSHLTYFRILKEVYLQVDDRWEEVDADSAPVAETFEEALKMAQDAANDRTLTPPLLFSNRVLEFNNHESVVKSLSDINSPTMGDIKQQERKQNDQEKFARVLNVNGYIRNAISGYQLMVDKFTLTRTLSTSKYLVPTILIQRGKIIDSFKIDENHNGVWFLKDPLVNKSLGIQLFKNKEEAIESCDVNKRYILQQEIIPMLVGGSYKFDIRVNVALVFTKQETKLYLYDQGILRSTSTKYTSGSTNTHQQFTNFCFQQSIDPNFENILPLNEWDTTGKYMAMIKQAICEIFQPFIQKLNTLGHRGLTILGLDFILDNQENLYLLEINYSPSTFISSHERVASICRTAISQLPLLAIHPLLFNSEPILQNWLDCLTFKRVLSNQDEELEEEEFDLFK